MVALPGFSMWGEVLVWAADFVARVLLAMGVRLRLNPCNAKAQCSFLY